VAFRRPGFFTVSFRDLSVEQQEQKGVFFAHRAGIPLGQREPTARREKTCETDAGIRRSTSAKIDDPIEVTDLEKFAGKISSEK